MAPQFRKRDMYRYPWSSNDNPIGWLEVTDKCNIYCRGCYRMNGMAGHKTVATIKEEIDLLKAMRNCDNISIAGGEPLIHPDIIEIVSYIKSLGMKPLILTNGVKLVDNKPLARELKKAGAVGFTFHIDSEQSRPHWKGKSEQELMALRQYFAEMIHEVGGMASIFGMTVYPGNLDTVPEIVYWANKNIHMVDGLVFITFRGAPTDGTYNYHVNGQALPSTEIPYTVEDDEEIWVTSQDVYARIKAAHPHYETAAYLGGTQSHTRATWVTSVQIGRPGQMYGSVGHKAMELIQTGYHFFNNSYLIYRHGNGLNPLLWLTSLFDKGVRQAHGQFWRDLLRNPLRALRPVYVQSIGIVQGPDILEDGRFDMCESCPDMTVWEGKLVHSCRMDEWRLYGGYVEASRNLEHPAHQAFVEKMGIETPTVEIPTPAEDSLEAEPGD